ncbi:MAG: signal recognition particle protein [Actinobacteria bacterium]|nr:signal recognition particle protein [Actinomycetota bacterium]MDI6831289.1 signal recognition particle protein [Actinomycetota bacterium]
MFDNLSDRLQDIFKRLRGHGRLSEKQVEEVMREIRLALLEADVNFKVVKDFIARVRERAVGQEVLRSLTPAQQVIKIVNEELTELLGSSNVRIDFGNRLPASVMLVGLQGSGKTTATAKLAVHLKNQGRHPMMVAADIYRPAAIDQLEKLGEQVGIEVYSDRGARPEDIVAAGLKKAEREGLDTVIIDTAGRLHIDDEMMQELVRIKKKHPPSETLLVVDAMTGQDAVNVAQAFVETVGVDGVILTKLDGDARGGAALSIKTVTGKPIKFASVGEKMGDLEPFYPERMASRILGMGDMLTLIEKAQASYDEKKAQELERKLRKQQFTLEDFLEQMHQLKKMGPLDQILGMIPGISSSKLKGLQVDESQIKRVEAIIQSMTPEERRKPQIIGASRKQRIARGSGTSTQDVNRLLQQFQQMQKLIKQFGKMSPRRMGQMFPFQL